MALLAFALVVLYLSSLGAAKKNAKAKDTAERPAYDRLLKHAGKQPYERVMNATVPEICPELLQPHDIHFMVLNMDGAVNRLAKMKARFAELELPEFQRIPGVLVKPGEDYGVPKRGLTVGDFGTALAHRAAWKAVIDGPHDWVLILEDDTELISNELVTEFPPVATECDFVMLNPITHLLTEPICDKTSVLWDHWGYGGIGYLVHRKGAQRLFDNSKGGFNSPVDGHIWYFNQGCLTKEQRVTHYPASKSDPLSIRQQLNGDMPKRDDW